MKFNANFDVAAVFSSVVNGVAEHFRQAIHHFSVITRDMVLQAHNIRVNNSNFNLHFDFGGCY